MLVMCLSFSAYAEEITYNDGERRDPFISLSLAEAEKLADESSSEYVLEGIVYDPSGGSVALLGDEAVEVGDSVGNATINKILKDRVILEINGENKILQLREEDIT